MTQQYWTYRDRQKRDEADAKRRYDESEQPIWFTILTWSIKLAWKFRITVAWVCIFIFFGVIGSGPTTHPFTAVLTGLLSTGLFVFSVLINFSSRISWLPNSLVKFGLVGGDLRRESSGRGEDVLDVNDWLRQVGIVNETDLTRFEGRSARFNGGFTFQWRSPYAADPEKLTKGIKATVHHFGCEHVVVEQQPLGWWRADYYLQKPVSVLDTGRAGTPGRSLPTGIVLGRDETGEDYPIDLLGDPWHTIIQGQTRSGKSVLVYNLLAGLADLSAQGRVIVGGVDPTGILLNPWADHAGVQYRALGLADPTGPACVVTAAVQEMDDRIAWLMKNGVDKLPVDSPFPTLVFVLEEYPGLVAALATYDQQVKPAERVSGRVKSGVQRLIQEGAKAGVRVVILAQRADASIVGGSERSNLGTRISLRVDNGDAVRMLHPEADPELVERIHDFKAGFAYIERPAEPPVVIRSDLVEYEAYAQHVKATRPHFREQASHGDAR